MNYAVRFVKANGKSRAKVFKLRVLSLAAKASVELGGRGGMQSGETLAVNG